jgi:DNA primase
MGTSLTDRQATQLQRFAQRVVLAMDADAAGSAANLRAIQVVAAAAERPRAQAGGRAIRALDIRVLALQMGKDPDELIRTDTSAWPLAIESARPVVDHLIAVVGAGLDLSQPRDRSQLVSEVLPVIGEISDPVLQAHYLQRLSRLARVSEDALRQQLPRRQRTLRSREEAAESAVSGSAPVRVNPVSSNPREEFALALLYHTPALAPVAVGVSEELFGLSENRELFRRWRAGEQVSEEEYELWEHQQKILELQIPMDEMAQVEVAFLDCMQRLEQVRMRAVKEASALALAEGEAGVRPGQVASIARARLGAGSTEENIEDLQADAVASQLLEDMEAGLRFHRRLIEGSRSDSPGRPSTQ